MYRVLAVMVALISGAQAWSQATPTAVRGADLGAFIGVGGGTTDVRDDKAIGGLLGGYFQTQHLWGIEARATAMRLKATYPQYSALGGVRGAKTFGRITPYVFLGAGTTRGYFPDTNISTPQYKMTVTGVVGVDYNFGRLSWRVLDFSIGRIKGTFQTDPMMANTGLVYHF